MGVTALGYSIVELEIDRLSEDDLRPIVELSNRLAVEREPRHVDLSVDEARMFFTSPGSIRRRFAVRNGDDRPVALMSTQYPDDGSNPDLLRVTMSVEPAHRRQGIGSELLRRAVEIARELGRNTLSGEVFDTVAAGGKFAAVLSATEEMDFHMNSLKISDLDRDLMAQWVEQGPGRAPGYSVRVVEGQYPEELLEGMAHLYLVLERDMPTPDSWEPREWTPELVTDVIGHFLQAGESLTAVAVEDETGEAAGMSQLFRRHTDPSTWLVTTTMVDPQHRGHALGKWVKGAANLEALEKWPGGEYQETGNAFTNEAMLGINRAMGFEHEYTMTNVEVAVDNAEAYLARRAASPVPP